MQLVDDIVIFAFLLSSLAHHALCTPILKRSDYAPCLVDGDCLAAQRCYWAPMADEPTGRCRFDLRKDAGEVIIGHRRYKRIRRSAGEGAVYRRTNDIDTNPAESGAEFPPKSVNGYVLPETAPQRPLELATGYERDIEPVQQTSEQLPNSNYDDNEPDMAKYQETSQLQTLVRDLNTQPRATDRPPQDAGNFEYVVNDDNTRDTFELNNANDVNLIHIPARGYGDNSALSEDWRRVSDNILHGNGNSGNAANGMEDDVDFADEISHDPLELEAAAEGAAIRAGDDLPRHRGRYSHRRWQHSDYVYPVNEVNAGI